MPSAETRIEVAEGRLARGAFVVAVAVAASAVAAVAALAHAAADGSAAVVQLMIGWLVIVAAALGGVPRIATAAAPAAASSLGPYLEDLTWTELRDRIKAGATTVLVPIGGVEQSGPYITLGKHDVRARVLAGRIAERLGNALVAPVVAYVPEGTVQPPSGHMRFPGTISVPVAAFESVLEGAARSLCQAGLHDVFFLGDHGDYQQSESRVAAKLGREWASKPGCRVHALLDYYRVTQTDFVDGLRSKGYTADEIGSHAGLADTSLMLAVDASQVRREALSRATVAAGSREGVHGDPRRASAELGQSGVERVITVSVARIRELTGTAP